jgi:glycosyltransferase involved in cell wall biosynthesis
MKVSVVIATFNRENFLRRAIDSVLNQTYQNFDLTIVDDGSSDNTYKLVKEYLTISKVKYIRTENRGVSAARNLGVAFSDGEYISFLDSDDEWLSHKLESQIHFLKTRTDLRIVHADEFWIRNGKKVNKKKIHQKHGGNIFEKCLDLCFISPSVALMERSLFNEFSGFDESFHICEDFDLWLKITSKYEVGLINQSLINKYGGHSDQLSTMFFAMDYYRIKSLDSISKDLNDTQISLVKKVIVKKSEILIKGYKKHGNLDNLFEIESILSNHKS